MPYANPKIQATYYRAYAKQPQRAASLQSARKRWADANRPHLNHLFNLRRQRVKARLVWYDPQAIEILYWLAETASLLFGKRYEVDHTIPLISHFVCGLHVPQNLEVVCRSKNRAKRNRVWPGMPNVDDPELKQLVKAWRNLTEAKRLTENPPHEATVPSPKTP